MRNQLFKFLCIVIASVIVFNGCSGLKTEVKTDVKTDGTEEAESKNIIAGGTDQSSGANKTDEPEAADQMDTASGFMDWLPKGVTKVMSETKPNDQVKAAIIKYYEIPEEEWGETRYYYNYVDLNEDNKDEIFVFVMGNYVSGSGGSSALLLNGEDGSIEQAFTLVNTPVIVTDEKVNGNRSLILQRSGGGAACENVILTYKKGVYTNVADAEAIGSIDDVKGTAIICNDLAADIENQNYLTLQD
ncbi:hypothetical protein KTH81_19615 [Lachnospiraceae bacterium ASD3451]|uniref:hypothetical protein n=1 Tax=Diplocloster agilis TaxID=2850323 RepID=UPI001E131C7F|nr:hypothetical protein [Diplocloster agilis]MBU9746032.1 hypothetical protein [Diplocloster agilis]